jgi:3-hydroxyisobutyrate dehydrogenase-like beta-hydroxyacid dehydrogenase
MGRTAAVIGLGAMGFLVARHPARAGVRVAVRDLDEAAVEAARKLGAEPATSSVAAAREAEAVAVFVPTDRDVLDVCLGSEGALAGAGEGAVVLLCSSVRPDTCREIAAAAPAGVHVLDAALTGGVRAAEAGAVNLRGRGS